MKDPTTTTSAPLPERLPQATAPGLYVHVPFCFHKCHYCDFYSITQQTPERMDKYVDLVLAECDQWLGGRRGPLLRPRTIFFGGGTPSLLPLPTMRRLVDGLKQRLDLSAVEEWTIECNPATVDGDYCAMLRDSGVDRLSFGAQSFDPAQLRQLDRQHAPADVINSITLARRAGFSRINVDLIYAIPGQDVASWNASLQAAIDLKTEHVSCYGLTYESDTPLAIKKRLGLLKPAEESLELQMLHHCRQRLAEVGYRAYEISNYALAGQACRHNLLYWNGGNYIGLGPAAASHVDGWRWRSASNLGQWEEAIAQGGLPAVDVEHLTAEQRAGELAMLQLRLADGVRFEQMQQLSGTDPRALYRTTLERLAGLNLISLNPDGFGLTDQGINVADAIAAEFVG